MYNIDLASCASRKPKISELAAFGAGSFLLREVGKGGRNDNRPTKHTFGAAQAKNSLHDGPPKIRFIHIIPSLMSGKINVSLSTYARICCNVTHSHPYKLGLECALLRDIQTSNPPTTLGTTRCIWWAISANWNIYWWASYYIYIYKPKTHNRFKSEEMNISSHHYKGGRNGLLSGHR